MKAVKWIVAGAVAAALAGCGAEEIASPGSGGNITINNPPPVTQEPPPTDPGSTLATPASGCPTIAGGALRDDGTITGPTGEYRVCALPATITASSTLERVAGLLYAVDGKVQVGADCGAAVAPGGVASPCKASAAATTETLGVTLTIKAGVVLFGKTGTSWLAVNRGHKISAVGTATQPIVFTSRDNILGLATDTSHGQWGGVVLMGRAPTTDCNVGSLPTSCERWTEGDVDNSAFGGIIPTDSSGTLDYVQIRYSGYVLGSNVELQSLTLEGVGSGTTIRHIQSHNSSDDGFENFGGNVDMRYLVLTGADDDSIDADTGYKGTIQYVIAAQKGTGGGDSMIELDSANANETQVPRTWLKLANFTLIHRNASASNGAAMRMRGQADVTLVNGIVTSPMACLTLEKPEILATNAGIEKSGPPIFPSVVMQCGGSTAFKGLSGLTDQQVADTFNASANASAAFTPTLTSVFVNGAAETARAAADPKALDSRFDTTTYVGAVKDAADTWYAGWTCNSATASFGSTSGACTSLPAL